MVIFKRNRTPSKYIYYAVQLYFSGYHFEKHHKGYPNLSKETTFPFGIGFSSITTSHKSYSIGKGEFMNL